MSQQEVVNFIAKYKSDLILWASPEVIKAQLEYEKHSREGNTNGLWNSVQNLLEAIREDIGLSNTGLDRLELVKLYLKDPKEIDSMI